uniref:Shisa N-terminal domain-containing protein n=1 Tax=Junco hyemalis TaxID=40217 RepID=A0A8C5IRG1_JUNHY
MPPPKRLCMIIPLLTNSWFCYFGEVQLAQSCPDFCCGSCLDRHCCSNVFLKFDEQKFQCNQRQARPWSLRQSGGFNVTDILEEGFPFSARLILCLQMCGSSTALS